MMMILDNQTSGFLLAVILPYSAKKDDIKINAFDGTVEVIADNNTNNSQRKYHETIVLPENTDIETAKSTYNNGILEITFDKKIINPKGKKVKIE